MISLHIKLNIRNWVTSVIFENYIIPMIPHCPNNSDNFFYRIMKYLIIPSMLEPIYKIYIRVIRVW